MEKRYSIYKESVPDLLKRLWTMEISDSFLGDVRIGQTLNGECPNINSTVILDREGFDNITATDNDHDGHKHVFR